jgi:ubiquinone/menaquinone biosynthesis C-methylase UbiE
VSFDVAADGYDRFMGRYSVLLSPQLADLAGVEAGQRALDVGCGTGMLTAELAVRLGPGAVAAIDPSESFVTAMRERHPDVDVRHGTAEQLPFADATFDVALAQLVVAFMTDAAAGVRDMVRVTRPGGVVALSMWDLAGGRAPISPFWKAALALDPTATRERPLVGGREGEIVSLLADAGLAEITQTELSATIEHPTLDDWWRPFAHGGGPVGTYIRTLDADRRAALREGCRDLLGDGPFALQTWAWAARGVVTGPE